MQNYADAQGWAITGGSMNCKNGSTLRPHFQVCHRLQTKSFLKAFSKVGGTAEAGIESGLGDVTVLVAEKVQGTK